MTNCCGRGARGVLTLGALAALWPAIVQSQERGPANEAEPTPRTNYWTFSLWGQQLWESNVRFLTPNDSGDLVSRAGGTLGRTWQGERGRVTFAASGDASRFQDQVDLNRVSYRVSGDASRRLTRRLTGQLAYAVTSAQTRELTVNGAATGVLLPFVWSRIQSANGAAAYRVSPTLEVRSESRYDQVHFDSPGLEDGWSAAERLSLSRRTERHGTFAASVEYARDNSQGRHGDVQTLATTWTNTLARRVDLRVAAGAVRVRQLGSTSAGATTEPVGGLELRRLGEHDALSLRVERGASQAFGFGRVLVNDQLGATYGRELTSLLSVALRGTYVHNTDPGGAFDITSQHYEMELRYLLTRNLTFVGGPFVRRQDQGTPISGRGMSVMLTYERDFR
jgi:hypothetical protein